jgi:hypothetical protein
MDDTLEYKQEYLRSQILEKGYDADNFMAFLQEKKGEDGVDLSNWNINELKEAVSEFTSIYKPIEDENGNIVNNNNSNQDDNIKNNNNNIIDNNNYNDLEPVDMNLVRNSHIKEYSLCNKTEVTTLSTKKNIKITVGFPEKNEGGMLSKSFISYLVNTQPFNYEVRKRYSDFAWLRSTLKKIYINCVIPPIPKKNYGDRFSDRLIGKRMRFLENFLTDCVNHPLLKHSELLFCFLSLTKKEEIESKKKEYNKKVSPFFVKNVKSLTGEVKTKISNELETYFINIKDHSDFIIENLQKLTKSFKSLSNLFDEVNNKMNDISKICDELYNISKKYYDKLETTESFKILSETMKDWGNIQKNQSDLVNINLREFFRYIKNEYKSLNDMISHVENNKAYYNKYAKNLHTKKENLFKTGDINKWDLNKNDNIDTIHLTQNKDYAFQVMLPKETLTVENLKQFYGFYLNSSISEYERLKETNAKRYQEKVTEFNNKLSNIIVNFHVSLADFLSNFDQELQKKKIDFNEEEKLDVDSKDIISKCVIKGKNDVKEDKKNDKNKNENKNNENNNNNNNNNEIKEKKDDKKNDKKKEDNKKKK